MRFFVVAVLSVCAAAQSVAFVCQGGSRSLTVLSNGSYSVDIDGVLWLPDGRVVVRIAQQDFSSGDGSLSLVSVATANGSRPEWGAFTSLTLNYTAAAAYGTVPVTASFNCFANGMLEFQLSWPEGAQSVNSSYISPDAVEGPCQPMTQFPSFATYGAAGGKGVGWMVHAGIWTLWEFWGLGVTNAFSACQQGPVYLFNTSFAPSTTAPAGAGTKTDLLLVSPLNAFHMQKSAVMPDPRVGDSRLSMGLASTITDIPAGYTTSWVMWHSDRGINNGTFQWGQLMRQAYNTTRIPRERDVLRSKLTYFTDNGAVYFQGYWDMVCPSRNCTHDNGGNITGDTVLRSLKQYHQQQNLPVAMYQLDTWWFYQAADVVNGGSLDCVDWTPRADLFPNGLPSVTQADVPLLLYSWGFVPPAVGNRMTNFTWETSLAYAGQSILQREAQPVLDQVYAFYSMIRDRFLAYNGTSMEEDNMGTHVGQYAQVLNSTYGAETWWRGFAMPWCESDIPMQICESTSADILESLKYPCITNSRDNIDDVPGQHTDPNFLHRWHVGFDRMFLSALGIAPFFDNVWTMPTQPGSSWGSASEDYLELAWILSVLTAGPVGFGDIVGNTNVSLVMTACMTDGTLLQTSTPSTYIDAVFLQTLAPFDYNTARIFQAHSFVPLSAAASQAPGAGSIDVPTAAPFTTVLAVDVAPTFGLLPSYLSPDLTAASVNGFLQPNASITGYVSVPWSPGFAGIASMCKDGAPAVACVSNFSAASPLAINTGVAPVPYQHNFEMYSLSPLSSCGYALLGELAKVVRVSIWRFPWIDISCPATTGPQLTFAVAGAAGEAVTVKILSPFAGGTLTSVMINFSQPDQIATVQCTGSSASPCSVSM